MKDQKLRVLLAEGGLSEMAQTLRSLYSETGRGLELTIISTIETLLPTIHVVDPDVLFLDLSLAYPNPLGAVRRVHRAVPGVPLIVFAVAAEKDCAAQCLNNGATDYLLKGHMDSRTLDRVLRTALERNTLKGLTDLLRDPLTGLYIRDGFRTLGSRSLETARAMTASSCCFAHWWRISLRCRQNLGLPPPTAAFVKPAKLFLDASAGPISLRGSGKDNSRCWRSTR